MKKANKKVMCRCATWSHGIHTLHGMNIFPFQLKAYNSSDELKTCKLNEFFDEGNSNEIWYGKKWKKKLLKTKKKLRIFLVKHTEVSKVA